MRGISCLNGLLSGASLGTRSLHTLVATRWRLWLVLLGALLEYIKKKRKEVKEHAGQVKAKVWACLWQMYIE